MHLTDFLLLLAATFASKAIAACSIQGSTTITFYGYPDNSPPGAGVAYDCGGRNKIAGGSGTYTDPVTFASAPGEFDKCEIIYLPYLEKYSRMEDTCTQCTADWQSGQRHVDIWTGSSTVDGGQDQIDCEDSLTPNPGYVIRYPDSSYTADSIALYKKGASSPCRTDQTFINNKAHTFCTTG